MPRGNRQGPNGQGPMTGRAAGYCAGNDTPGFAGREEWIGRGRRCGAGFGPAFRAERGAGWNAGRGPGLGTGRRIRGRGWRCHDEYSREPWDAATLRSEAEALEARLDQLRVEIGLLEHEGEDNR
ncbi:MAG: DUF5320 domain-containing protein [Spirochaetota bacterium]